MCIYKRGNSKNKSIFFRSRDIGFETINLKITSLKHKWFPFVFVEYKKDKCSNSGGYVSPSAINYEICENIKIYSFHA